MRQKQGVFSLFLLSPSSRRAWIEIELEEFNSDLTYVALLAEGVDRNSSNGGEDFRVVLGRPPRGGRG